MAFSLKHLVTAQLNPFDGPKAAPMPASTSRAIQTAKYGVLANNPQAQQQFIQGQATPKFNPLKALPGAAVNTTKGLVQSAVQLPLQTSENFSNTFANIGNRLAGVPNQSIQHNLGYNPVLNKTLQYSGATGQNKQLAADAGQVGLAIGAGGVGKAVSGAFGAVAPKVIPAIIPQTIANAGTGTLVGAPFSVLNAAGSNQPLTFNNLKQAGVQGAQAGALLGGAGTLAGAAGRGATTALTPKYAGLTKNQVIMDTNKLNTLNAARDYNPFEKGNSVQAAQDIIRGLHQIKQDHGLDFITGSPAEKQQRITQFLEQNGEAIPQLQAHQAKIQGIKDATQRILPGKGVPLNQGGYLAGPLARGFGAAKLEGKVFKGVDGKPRFEGDDSGAQFKDFYKHVNSADTHKLGDVLDHPELYKQYPELKDVPVKFNRGAVSDGTKGQSGKAGIILHPESFTGTGEQIAQDMKGTLLHEVQHVIQKKEGYAGGTAPISTDAQQISAIKQNLAENYAGLDRIADPNIRRKIISEISSLEKQLKSAQDAPYKAYRDSPGEVEARTVQDRQNMTAAERAKHPLANPAPKLPGAASTPQQLAQLDKKIAAFGNDHSGGYSKLVAEREALTGKTAEHPLAAEARKYGSAEEFIKAKTNAHHGTRADFDTFDNKFASDAEGRSLNLGWGRGNHYFTKNPDEALKYATRERDSATKRAYQYQDNGKPRVVDANVDLKKPFDLADPINNERWRRVRDGFWSDGVSDYDYTKIPKSITKAEALVRQLKKEGYDGIADGNEITAFDAKNVLTSKQLTDIYNQAHATAPKPSLSSKLHIKPLNEGGYVRNPFATEMNKGKKLLQQLDQVSRDSDRISNRIDTEMGMYRDGSSTSSKPIDFAKALNHRLGIKKLDSRGSASGDSPLMPLNKPIANAVDKLKGKTKKYQTIHSTGMKEVEGEPIDLVKGVETFTHKDENGNWVVSEATTGRNLTNGGFVDKHHAVQAAQSNIRNVGEAKFKQMLSENQLSAKPVAKQSSKSLPKAPAVATAVPKKIVSSKESIPLAKQNGDAYEATIAKQLQATGGKVTAVGKDAGRQDGGVDLIHETADGTTKLIQAKFRSRDTTIHLSTVAQLDGAAARYRAANPGKNVVPTIYATKPLDADALAYAKTNGIDVVQTGLKGETVKQQVAGKAAKQAPYKLTETDKVAIQNSIPVSDRADFLKQVSDANSGLSKRLAGATPDTVHQIARKYYQGLNPEGSFELNQAKAVGAKLADAKTPAEVTKIIGTGNDGTALIKTLRSNANDKAFIQQLADTKTKSGIRELINGKLEKPVYSPLHTEASQYKTAEDFITAKNLEARSNFTKQNYGDRGISGKSGSGNRAAGFEAAAVKRAVSGELTPTEFSNTMKYLNSNYVGKKVAQGEVVGNSFGVVRVKTADGKVISVNPSDITAPAATKAQVLAHAKAQATKKLNSSVGVLSKQEQAKLAQVHAEATTGGASGTKQAPVLPGAAVPRRKPVSAGTVAKPGESSLGKNTMVKVSIPEDAPSSGMRQRGLATTIMDDPNTSAKVKAGIGEMYKVRNTKDLQARAANLVKDDPELAMRVFKSDSNSDVGTMVGGELAAHLSRTGQHEAAIEVAQTMSREATNRGQANQALSTWGKLAPESILRFAQNHVNQYNKAAGLVGGKGEVRITPEQAKKLTGMSQELQKMTPGHEKDIATQKMVNQVKELIPASWVAKLSTGQTIAQLLNPKTLIRNIGGNSLLAGLDNVSQSLAAGIDKATSAVRGSQREVALPSLKTQFTSAIKGGKEQYAETTKGVNLGPETQFDLADIPTFRTGAMAKVEKTMGVALRVPDRAAFTAAYDDTVQGLMKANKLAKPTQEILDLAEANGLYRTFQNNSKAAQLFTGLKKALNVVGFEGKDGKRWGLGDSILKYPKTPGNIVSVGLDYSPAGIVKGLYEIAKPAITGKPFNQAAFAQTTARGIVGSSTLMGAGAVLGALGIITEKPSQDTDTRNLQKASGQGGYQINTSALRRFITSGLDKNASKLQKGDTLVSYDWAQPASIPLSAGAALGKKQNAKDAATSTLSNVADGLNTLVEQPLVTGVNTFSNNIKNYGYVGALGKTVQGAPASFVPTAVNQGRQLTDNNARSTYDPSGTKTALNMVKNKIPGLDRSLPNKVDALGNNQQNYQNGTNNLFNVALNPAFVTKYQPDAQANLPLDILNRSGETKQIPTTTKPKQNVNGVNTPLTAQQNHDFQKYVGDKTRAMIQTHQDDPAFMALDDTAKANELSKQISNIQAAARAQLLGDTPSKSQAKAVDRVVTDNLTYTHPKSKTTTGKTTSSKTTTKSAKAKSTGSRSTRGVSNTSFAAALKAANGNASRNQSALINLVRNAKVSGSSRKLNVRSVALKKQSVKKQKAKVA